MKDNVMLYKNEDAGNYDCCQLDKKCTGEQCPAWKVHFNIKRCSAPDSTKLPWPIFEKTEFGYCGLVKK